MPKKKRERERGGEEEGEREREYVTYDDIPFTNVSKHPLLLKAVSKRMLLMLMDSTMLHVQEHLMPGMWGKNTSITLMLCKCYCNIKIKHYHFLSKITCVLLHFYLRISCFLPLSQTYRFLVWHPNCTRIRYKMLKMITSAAQCLFTPLWYFMLLAMIVL